MKRTMDQVKSERAKVKAAYQRLFTMPEAELVMKDLERQFNYTTLKIVNGAVDVHASMAAAGSREVLLYIDYMMENETYATAE